MTPQEQYLKETKANTIWKIPNHTYTDEYVEWIKNYVKTSDNLATKMVRQFANNIKLKNKDRIIESRKIEEFPQIMNIYKKFIK